MNYDVVPDVCPGCKTELGQAIGYGKCGPKEDDLSVCWYCGCIMVFNADMTVRPLTESEKAVLSEGEVDILEAMREEAITRHHRAPSFKPPH